jgi:hypothetical protein
MPINFYSQIELPIAADNNKSPIRKHELDNHLQSDLHIQNAGYIDQMLVMTAVGPRMMTPRLTCSCGGGHYGCDCRIVFEEPPQPPTWDHCIPINWSVDLSIQKNGAGTITTIDWMFRSIYGNKSDPDYASYCADAWFSNPSIPCSQTSIIYDNIQGGMTVGTFVLSSTDGTQYKFVFTCPASSYLLTLYIDYDAVTGGYQHFTGNQICHEIEN